MRNRIKSNLFAAVFGKSVLILQQFLLLPVFLSKWGVEYYGAWLIISALPATLSSANLGLGPASSTRAVLALGRGDVALANKGVLSASVILFIIYIPLTIGFFFIPADLILIQNTSCISHVSIILGFLMASAGVNSLAGPFEGYWVARGMAARQIWIQSGFQLLNYLAIALTIFFGGSGIHVACIQFIITSIGTASFIYLSCKLVSWEAWELFDIVSTRALIKDGIGFQLSSVWQAIYFQGSIFLANSFLGTSGVAAWTVVRIISRLGCQLLNLSYNAFYPEFQSAISKNDLDSCRKIFTFGLTVSLIVGFCFAFGLSVFGSALVTFWTDSIIEVPDYAWFILSMGFIFNSTWWTSQIIPFALNQPWFINSRALVASFASILTMYFLLMIKPSLISICLGYIVFDMLMAFAVLLYSLKKLHIGFYAALKQGLKTIQSELQLIYHGNFKK